MEDVSPKTRAPEIATTTDRNIDVPLEPVVSADTLNLRALRESKERYRTLFELAPWLFIPVMPQVSSANTTGAQQNCGAASRSRATPMSVSAVRSECTARMVAICRTNYAQWATC